MRSPFHAILLSVLVVTFARAQSTWTLTTADFKSESVSLKGVDASGLRVVPAGGGDERTVALDQFLSLERPLPTAQGTGRFVLHMTGDDKLGGEPAGMKGESLVWKNPSLGEISIPTRRLVAITQPDKPVSDERRRDDVLTLANGDTVRGIISQMTADAVSIQGDAGNTDVPLSSVVAIAFAATPGAATSERGFRVRLDDGSALVGASAALEGDALRLDLGKNAVRSVKLEHVAGIEQVNGPVSWLSSRPPSESIYVPFFGTSQDFPACMDRSVTGGDIAFKDHKFSRGIGVHAYSRLSWPLDGSFKAFRTRYAIDGEGARAEVTVRVKLDDKVAYEQPHVRAGALSPVVVIDLGSARKLTLEVEGGPGYVQDRLNWIEPALLRIKPADVPATPSGGDKQ